MLLEGHIKGQNKREGRCVRNRHCECCIREFLWESNSVIIMWDYRKYLTSKTSASCSSCFHSVLLSISPRIVSVSKTQVSSAYNTKVGESEK